MTVATSESERSGTGRVLLLAQLRPIPGSRELLLSSYQGPAWVWMDSLQATQESQLIP